MVDDNAKFLKSLAERARLKGFTVFEAENGEKALEIAKKEHINVAVVDQKMPDMEGLMVLTRLKTINPHIKGVLLTGYGGNKLKEATEALNSTYFDKGNMGGLWEYLSNLPFGKINILLVDDNPKILTTMAERIRLKGYEPLIAENGKEAIEIAETHDIQMAVVDQRMPDMEGLDVITKLKAIDPTIVTLLLTAHGDEKLKMATEALNSSYFEKEDMGTFWKFIRKSLQTLEKTMAAAGMATGGDLNDALEIEKSGSGESEPNK